VLICLHIRATQYGKFLKCFVTGWAIGGSFRQETLDLITAQEAIAHAVKRTANAVKEIGRIRHN